MCFAIAVQSVSHLQGNKLHQIKISYLLKSYIWVSSREWDNALSLQFPCRNCCHLQENPGLSAFTNIFWIIPTLYLVKVLYRIEI